MESLRDIRDEQCRLRRALCEVERGLRATKRCRNTSPVDPRVTVKPLTPPHGHVADVHLVAREDEEDLGSSAAEPQPPVDSEIKSVASDLESESDVDWQEKIDIDPGIEEIAARTLENNEIAARTLETTPMPGTESDSEHTDFDW